MVPNQRSLYLCNGLQSSGTTLVSWCFLQRSDLNGILDASSEVLADLERFQPGPPLWLKTTTVSFRLSEQVLHFQDLGWTVRPLLVCRDVRAIYASLRRKPYGRNSTTAEDPPLRLRFRRFREDWEKFRDKNWPIIRFNDLLNGPDATLNRACTQLGLPWDPAMLSWPKPRSAIWDARYGNETFNQTRANDLTSAVTAYRVAQRPLEELIIPPSELVWLEKEFAEFNRVNGYSDHISMRPGTVEDAWRAMPAFRASRRFAWRLRRSPIRYCRIKPGNG